jgi:hypothetical protein
LIIIFNIQTQYFDSSMNLSGIKTIATKSQLLIK